MNLKIALSCAAAAMVVALASASETLYVACDDPNASDEAGAKEIFVDCNHPNAADTAEEGRGGEDLPYLTILAAVEAANADDTVTRVWVKPGVYESGDVAMGSKSSTGADWNNNNRSRAIISRPFRLEATGSAADTEIRGHFGPLGQGCGNGAIRCLQVNAAGAGAVVKGITFANGATKEDYNGARGERGGGVFAETEDVYIVDCVFTNCCARKGSALCGGTALRCTFSENRLYSGDSGIASGVRLWFCNIRQASSGNGCQLFTDDSSVAAVNTTFFLHNAGFSAASGCSFYNCLFTRAVTLTMNGTMVNSVDSLKGHDLANPYLAAPDLRLLSYSGAVGAGKVTNIRSVFAVPDEFAATDVYGNVIDYDATDCHAGACQVTVSPTYGGIGFRSSSGYIDGVYVPDGGYVFATEYPHVFKLAAAGGKTIHYLSGLRMNHDGTATSETQFSVYPWAEDFPVAAPYASGQVYAFWTATASDCLWVDQHSESATEDGTEENPYRTIQDAIDHCQAATAGSKYSIIYVKPGDYAGGLDSKVQSGSYCQLRAVGSKEETVIRAAPEGRCANNFTLVRGFTLTGASNSLEGAVASSCTLVDCIVSNNVATSSRLLRSCSLCRCLVTGNATPSSLIRGSGAAASLIIGNSCATIFHGDAERVKFCTIADNEIQTTAFGNPVHANNTILEAGGVASGTRTDSYSNLVWNALSYAANWIHADPVFASRENGDYRPTADSPAVGAGRSDLDNFIDIPYDFAGAPIGRVDGVCSLGCYQSAFPYRISVIASNGGLELSGLSVGDNIVECGEERTISISANDSGTRRPIAVDIARAGQPTERVLFADQPGGVWTTTVRGPEDAFTAVAVYGPWYIDCQHGLDTNDGCDAEHARKTFKSVMSDPNLSPGDTVFVLPGVYDDPDDCMLVPDALYTYSRLVIPAGVTVRSTDGCAATEICGADSPFPQASYRWANDGCGTNATRCVYLGSGARLEGFTLKNGRTFENWDPLPANRKTDYYGAAAYGQDRSAKLVDCEIRGCRGGSVIRAVTACRCAFYDNGRNAGITVYDSKVCESLVFGCYQGSAMSEGSAAYNSIIACQGGFKGVGDGKCTVYNSLLLGHADSGSDYYDCVFATNATYKAWNSGSTYQNAANCENCEFTYVEALGVGADWRPSKTSVLVDCGNAEFLSKDDDDRATDFAGVPRVLNAAVDVGPFEYDWRVDATDLLNERRKAEVTMMSPEVYVDLENGVLRLPAGARLEATLAAKAGHSCGQAVTVTGAGVLKVYLNGTLIAEKGAGTWDLDFGKLAASNALVYVVEGDATAELAGMKSLAGMMLIFR